MIPSNFNSTCTETRLYYFDYLNEQAKRNIPASVLEHIVRCPYCQAEIERLDDVLAHAAGKLEPEQARKDSAITSMLRLHFAYTGLPVKCKTVRPFLASLADPVLRATIPTPITAHIENCQACSDDLRTVSDLQLTHKQLCRLGQLLAEKPPEDKIGCPEARAAIPSVATMILTDTKAQVLKHLCICSDCKKALYEHWEKARLELLQGKMAQEELPCEGVPATDIFEYSFPYGIDPAVNQRANIPEPFAFHLRSCPKCLAKLQQLHKTVRSVAERSESGIVTCYRFKEEIRQGVQSEATDSCVGWPVDVQVFDESAAMRSEATERTVVPERLKQRTVSAPKLMRFIKPVAAAAVILIGVLLLFNVPAARAIDLSQVYNALSKIASVRISRFAPGTTEPIQVEWVSRTFRVRMFSEGGQLVLWDIKNKVKKTKTLSSGSIETDPVASDVLARVEESIVGMLGLMPFSDISDVPEGAKWYRVDDKDVEATIAGTEVYDLLWTKKTPQVESHKWRYFVDTRTNLPRRIEVYLKKAFEENFTLYKYEVVTYLTDAEIKALIQSISD